MGLLKYLFRQSTNDIKNVLPHSNFGVCLSSSISLRLESSLKILPEKEHLCNLSSVTLTKRVLSVLTSCFTDDCHPKGKQNKRCLHSVGTFDLSIPSVKCLACHCALFRLSRHSGPSDMTGFKLAGLISPH